MEPKKDKWALVTGASGGIGKDISELFASDKINLVLTARNMKELQIIKSSLEKTYGVKVEVLSYDLSDERSAIKLFNETKDKHINITYLVNNAGFGSYGDFVETDFDVYDRMINLNIKALTHLTHLYVKDMVDRKEGRVLNIASTAAFQPIPSFNVYSSTKSFVLNFSEALNYELKDSGVSVTVLCPGGTKTKFHRTAGFNIKMESKSFLMDSKKVARIGYNAMMKGKSMVVSGWMNKLMTISVKFAPRFLIPGISKKVMNITQK